MSAPFEDMDPAGPSPEDRVNAMRGYKATLNNPRVSDDAKNNAKDVLDNQLGGDQPRQDLYAMRNPTKEPNRVQGGLKAATKNPRVSEDAKNRAQEKLGQLSNAIAEQSQQEQPMSGRCILSSGAGLPRVQLIDTKLEVED